MIVTIPSSSQHAGFGLITLEISDFCPKCGGSRGKIFGAHSYDGSLRLNVDSWHNPCGHVDTYAAVREEGQRIQYKEPTEYQFIATESLPF